MVLFGCFVDGLLMFNVSFILVDGCFDGLVIHKCFDGLVCIISLLFRDSGGLVHC